MWGVAIAATLACAAPAAAQATPPSLAANVWCHEFSDYLLPCPGLEVREPVRAEPGDLATQSTTPLEFRFYRCATASTPVGSCTARSPWQEADTATFPEGDAGAWAVAAVRGTVAGSPEVRYSGARQLVRGPELEPGARYEVSGTLPDGSARPGMVLEARPAEDFPSPAATGVPEPEVVTEWHIGRDIGTFLPAFGPRRVDHEGPLEVPPAISVRFMLLAENGGGTGYRGIDVPVRYAPLWSPDAPAARTIEPAGTLGDAADAPDQAGRTIGYPAPQLSWQWERCAATCTDIPGATGPTYAVQRADGGHHLQRSAVARNDEGEARRVTLRTAAPVPAGEVSCGGATGSTTKPAVVRGALLRALRRELARRPQRPLSRIARRHGIALARTTAGARLDRASLVRSLSSRSRLVLMTISRGTSTVPRCDGGRDVATQDLLRFSVVRRGARVAQLACLRGPRTSATTTPACDEAFARRVRRAGRPARQA